VILPTHRLHLPPGFREDFGTGDALVLPLFLEKLLAGALLIAKAGLDSRYTPGEIELSKAATKEAMLVIEYLHRLNEQAETRARALVLQEVHHLANDFLNLASHELNTSLTMTRGNIQLAQRRLARLKRQLAEQPEHVSEQIEGVQQSLASAASSTRQQEHIIKELIDDARIQANTLELHLQHCDLIVLLKAAVTHQQRLAPERTIVLDLMPAEKAVPIIADVERIIQVINSYMANALNYSPADQPVTVQLTVEDGVARVTVHDEGPGIPFEEQERIWERFYYVREITEQHEPDLSLGLGLGLYLSRAFIERHHGSVGVQSEPGHGATFWFTLPIETSTEDEG
jgi:signal transduction histidine kinase